MKKLIIILCVLCLVGCQSPSIDQAPAFASAIVEVNIDELSTYWQVNTSKAKRLNKRPAWLPKGKGEWTVLTVIDSNGIEVERTLLSSLPEGFMTQSMLNKMPKVQYQAAPTNKERIPVKFYGTSKIAPRSEL